MILTDANIWIDHFRSGDDRLVRLLRLRRILMHPFTIGELSLGSLPDRPRTLANLALHDQPVIATDDEVLALIEAESLWGTGLGYVDCHLLASARLTNGCRVWTRDRRLHSHAERLGVAYI